MSTILEMIKRNQVPAAVMRTASKGALAVPAEQMLEILVYLTQNPLFAQDAKMTLAAWDFNSAFSILSRTDTPPEVLGYFWAQENRRPGLMPALIDNPAIPEMLLVELACEAPREIVTMLMASQRARNSYAITEALGTNPNLTPDHLRELRGETAAEPENTVDAESAAVHQAFEREHAAEIAAEEGKGFRLVQGEGEGASGESAAADPAGAADPPPAAHNAGAAPMVEEKKLTLLQRLGRMKASERVKAAFTSGREERAVLIRDGARVVQNAVLASPKLTDPEVEVFAAAKNVHENVLREIARNRRFMKNYSVVRNLVQNPKTPLDIALPLVKMLMVYDLKALQRSRNVSETIRSLAAKYYREKALSGGRTKE
jgi:hypothetical protein